MDHITYMLVDFWSAERVASLPTPVQGGSLAPHPLMSIQKQSCPGLLMPWMGSMVFTMVGATIGFTGCPLVTMVGYVGWSTWSRSPSRCEADISKLLWCRCHFSSRTYVGKVHVLSLAHTQNAFKASRKGKRRITSAGAWKVFICSIQKGCMLWRYWQCHWWRWQ